MKECIFCTKFGLGIQKEKYDASIFEFPNFLVVPDMAPLAEGHTLMVSKIHAPSIASLNQKKFTEFVKIKRKLKKIMTQAYRKPIFFEHGDIAKTKRAACCIDHAHMHCLPSNVKILEDIQRDFKGTEIKNIQKLRAAAGKKYIYFEDTSGKMYLFDAPRLPGQYLRKLIAEKIGNPEKWDFAIFTNHESALKTLEKLRRH